MNNSLNILALQARNEFEDKEDSALLESILCHLNKIDARLESKLDSVYDLEFAVKKYIDLSVALPTKIKVRLSDINRIIFSSKLLLNDNRATQNILDHFKAAALKKIEPPKKVKKNIVQKPINSRFKGSSNNQIDFLKNKINDPEVDAGATSYYQKQLDKLTC